MKLAFLPVLAAIALSGCDRSAKVTTTAPAKAAARPAVAPLPTVKESEIRAPAALTVKVAAGSNLRAIALEAYGHERFSGFVAKVNGIPNPERVAAGAILKTPSLPAAFREAGLDARYRAAINALAKASNDYYAELPGYREARRASGMQTGTFAIPEQSRDTFFKCADAIDAANQELESAKEPHQVPRMTIEQFAKVSTQLRELAAGKIDGYGYDYEEISRGLGVGFTNALVWTQQQHR